MEDPTLKLIPFADIDIITTSPRLQIFNYGDNIEDNNYIIANGKTFSGAANMAIGKMYTNLGLTDESEMSRVKGATFNYNGETLMYNTTENENSALTLRQLWSKYDTIQDNTYSTSNLLSKIGCEWFYCQGVFYNVKQ